jgi:hypothetical protein
MAKRVYCTCFDHNDLPLILWDGLVVVLRQ